MIIPSYFTAQEVVPISNEHEEGAESIKELGQPTPHTHPHLFGSHQEGMGPCYPFSLWGGGIK